MNNTDFKKIADDVLSGKHTSTGIVVNGESEIVYVKGKALDFLRQPPGRPTNNILQMARHGLDSNLSHLLENVKTKQLPTRTAGISLLIDGLQQDISIEAMLLPGMAMPHYLLIFHTDALLELPVAAPGEKINVYKKKNIQTNIRIQRLEEALTQNRHDLRQLSIDHDAANEKLQSAHEEMICTSEELQVLNNELEAGKEELQASNDSLIQMNDELVRLNNRVNNGRLYAESIIATVQGPLLVMDQDLRVKTANKAFYTTFKVSELETEGVLVYDLGNKQWNIPQLHTLLEEILPQKTSITNYEVRHHFPSIGERVMELNACRIFREKEDEKLILLSIQDITEKTLLHVKEMEFQHQLEQRVQQRTLELSKANEALQQQNQEIALSKYNKRFLTEFSEKFSDYKIHNEFFNSLTQFIADATRLDYVYVGKLVSEGPGKFAVDTLALNAFGRATENIRYSLPDNPCEKVLNGVMYTCPKAFRQLFPKSKTIEAFEVEGYLAYPLHDNQGNAVGLIAAMHRQEIEDVDTVASILKIVAKRAETELERINHERQLVDNNTSLAEKNNELVKMNKELQAFTFISSHDLQEPLRKIKTFTQLIRAKENDNLTERGKDYLDRVCRSALHMQNLITDLLDYSQSTNTEHKFEQTDLKEIIADVEAELNEVISKKKAIITTQGLCKLKIIPFQFRQLFNNLLSNSIKFAVKGRLPRIDITATIIRAGEDTLRLAVPGKEYCRIVVADNGIGFSPEYSQRIFEIFQRLNSKEDYPGTGIGLAIVKKIVENHNGFITANGVLNEGAIFELLIPVE